jgi:ribose 5-phosphate isomerase B
VSGRRAVITEREVQRAQASGARTLDVRGAVVTPSARDAAARAGIVLETGGAERARGAGGVGAAGAARGREGGRGAPPAKQSSPSSPPPPHQTTATPAEPAPARGPVYALALGADHGGVVLKDAIATHLREKGHAVTDLGTSGTEAVDYPDFAAAVARAVGEGRAAFGIMVDGAGIGSCMAANKVRGVRAAMCHDITTAVNAREHNDANVLTLGGGLLGTRLALDVVTAFLATPFGGGRHAKRVAKIDALDRRG